MLLGFPGANIKESWLTILDGFVKSPTSVRQAVRQAHGPERGRRTHGPE